MERKILESSQLRMRSHCIHMDNRQLMSVTGVKHVDSFNEYEIALLTDAGELHIEGNDLHISKLNLDDGQVVLEGEIIALEYSDEEQPRGSIFSRMFK